ncbi:Oligopeptide transport ATP-binding protein OppD [Caprobacter fermentans]|uniref:Oligopeptide transport ATP-binding protein OppD n=1 Tax=Caproicibacter fermentans TaxID=2576756 RepID=A0A6N8I6M3_9FIRM|nr:ABC transporter ATP-binding protein [Caproicibacter fermentans]MVB13120.1 Oligopeptide transport ATP-binding protein OppD [Caproicibacter fermentans]OCN01030.1 dipeptide/oligopeptide/nickel ABC transporter ATP-binding protein [Clostridium sp. W14A]
MAFIEFKNLSTWFYTESGIVKAVNGVSFEIPEGKTVCVVGESGCGKSVTALSLMHLVQTPPGKIVEGEILMDGEDLLKKSNKEMQQISGNKISMIFQEPMTSLNPVYTVGYQIMENLLFHTNIGKKEAREKAIEMIRLVNIPRAEEIVDCYPHELSGGMRQRIMIAMALICNPRLLIADEPTTALDVTIQAQILDLMRKLKDELNMSILLITHDLGVVAEMADYVVVMYAGKVIEKGNVADIFAHPTHPYTVGLLKSKPVIGQTEHNKRLYSIPGQVPNPVDMPENCYFNERCEFCTKQCKEEMPVLREIEPGHSVACWVKPEQ